jgi:hypothetical protein
MLTGNMGLTLWDLPTDFYDHSQLANNFAAIDLHQHIPGQGRQIPTAGLLDYAVTSIKIQADAVTPDKIPNGSISQQELSKPSVGNPELFDNAVSGAKIQDGTIGASKVNSTISYVGKVEMWYRVSPSISPPIGWEICDGRPWSGVPNAMGPGLTNWTTGNMPNMINKFVLGAATTGTGTGIATPPDIGAVGGAHGKDMTHTHTVSHSHNVNSHTHPMDHTHSFGTSVDGSHGHTFAGGYIFHTRMNAFQQLISVVDYATRASQNQIARVNNLQSAYLAGWNEGAFDAAFGMDPAGAHSHTGGTSGASTASTGGGGGTTDVQTPTTSAGTLGATYDVRPAHIGLLYIMRVI